jgi:hypothetical protein
VVVSGCVWLMPGVNLKSASSETGIGLSDW